MIDSSLWSETPFLWRGGRPFGRPPFFSLQKTAAGMAGADRVGVSLWCIDDEATAEFRRSEDFDHPYYWAAFVLYE